MKKRLLFLLFLFLSSWKIVAEAGSASVPLYAASFDGLDGQPVALSNLRGKVAVINFWASWCPPCRKEIPDLIAAYGHYRDRGVAFVGIAVEDDLERVRDFARAYEINYPLVAGKEKGIALMQTLGNTVAGLPYTLVLDEDGNVVAMRRGPMDQARLEQAVQEALSASKNEHADSK